MRFLLSYLFFFKRRLKQIILGFLLTNVTLIANICLLTLSGLFLSGTATVGVAGIYIFNYMLTAIGMRISAILRTICRWAERIVNHDATFHILKYLRIYIFIRIFPLFPSAIKSFKTTELLNNLVSDVDTIDNLYLRVILPIGGTLGIILTVTFILYLLDPKSGFTLCILILCIFLLLPLLFYHSGKLVGESITVFRANYRHQLNTWLYSNAELTVYGAEYRYRNKLDDTEKQWQVYQNYQNSIIYCVQSVIYLLTGLTLTLVLWIAAGSAINNNYYFREPIAILFFVTLSIYDYIGTIAGILQYLGQVIASAVRINIIINQLPKVIFPSRDHKVFITKSVTCIANKIVFKYPHHNFLTINNLSLNISAGEHIALLGHTGSGKSTLLQLFTRSWDPQKGYIKFNGIPLPQWSEKSLRAMTAVLPQRIYIFSATLRDNLILAVPYIGNDERICMILNLVGLEILLKEKGLNLWIGDGGRQLSVGEKLRLGIARILLHEAPLWLLDEPTDGLDIVTEKQILQLLIKLGKGRTLIMVTHRLHELENFDCIYIMDRGTFIEKGTHKKLIEQQGHYYKYHLAGS